MTAARASEAAGCSSSISEDTAAGSRGSDEVISSQPAVWLSRASTASQPMAGQSGCRPRPPKTSPKASAATAAPRVASATGACDVRGRSRGPAQDQQVARVGDGRPDAVPDAGERMLASRWRADQAGDEHDAEHHDRQRERYRAARPLMPDQPGDAGHEQDLEIAEHGRHASADIGDGMCPQDQVHGEEQAGDNGPDPLGQRSRRRTCAARSRRA